MTYATLKADVATWARRADLTSAIPSFVALAEMEIFKTHQNALRVRDMEIEADLTVTSLVATVPADFLDARYIKVDNASQTTLYYKPPEAWTVFDSGFFTIVGDEIRVPNGVTSGLKLVYYAQPAALANDADTNAVLEKYYGIYFSASMKYASAYVKDAASVAGYQGQIDIYMDGASRHGKAKTAGPLVVRAA